MANTYFWDLGFDFNAVQKTNTTSYLQNGLMLNGLSAFPRDIKEDDIIHFNAFNLTTGASTTDGTTIIASSFNFINALVTQADTTPFASQAIATTTGAPAGTSVSIPLSPTVPVPFWTLATQTMVNPGSFLFTVALIVQRTGGTNNVRMFVVDPEMIVGGNN